MTGRERDDEEREGRSRIRITDKRRFRDDATTSEEGAAPAGEVGAVSPDAHEGRPLTVEPGGNPVVGVSEPVEETAEGGDAAGDLEAARAEAREYLDHLRRLQAEFDNYRKRVLKEQTRAVEMAAEPVVLRLLEVLDEFELALMAAADKPDFDRFLHGVELVYAKLLDTLRAEGLERIEADGKPFDPGLHEALMQTGEGEGEPVVADVLRPGYTLKGRVIRPAGVRVRRG